MYLRKNNTLNEFMIWPVHRNQSGDLWLRSSEHPRTHTNLFAKEDEAIEAIALRLELKSEVYGYVVLEVNSLVVRDTKVCTKEIFFCKEDLQDALS